MNVSPDNITTLAKNEVFVFGSNLAGRHGKGAALQAVRWGAKKGVGEGRQGRTYAIPTKDANLGQLPLYRIAISISAFIMYARLTEQDKYLVTAIGTGLAKFSHEDIARLFFTHEIPDNVFLPKVFWDLQ